MDEKVGGQKKSTKSLIIDAAFSFFREPRFHDFSMSEVAARVGVSKPAIYRHFSGKDALLSGMESRFFDEVSERVLAIQSAGEGRDGPFAALVCFFVERSEFINYIICQMTRRPSFERELAEAMRSRGVRDERAYLSPLHPFGEDVSGRTLQFYIGLTMFMFIKFRERAASGGAAVLPPEEFSRRLVAFITGGLGGSTDAGDVAHPVEIPRERRDELSSLCSVGDGSLFPEENPVFRAVAACIERDGVGGVTLERVADLLGKAKSSLYYYFDGKRGMMTSLVEREFFLLSEFVRENSVEARSFSEFVWILFRSEIEFFLSRPSVVPTLGWLLQGAAGDPFGSDGPTVTNVWEKRMGRVLSRPDLGFPLPPEYLTTWLGAIPAMASIFARKHAVPREELLSMLDGMFAFAEFGISPLIGK